MILMNFPAVRMGFPTHGRNCLPQVILKWSRSCSNNICRESTYTNAIEQLLLKWSGCDDCNISMYDVIGFYYGHVTMFW